MSNPNHDSCCKCLQCVPKVPPTSISILREDAEFAKTVLATPNISSGNIDRANQIIEGYLVAIKG